MYAGGDVICAADEEGWLAFSGIVNSDLRAIRDGERGDEVMRATIVRV